MAQEEKKGKNRLRYMILSIIIAVVAWSVVTYATDPDITKTFAGVRVELIGEDELKENGYVVVARDDLPKLSVKMSGKRSDLIKSIDKTKILLDVSGIDEEGEIETEIAVKLPNSRVSVEKVSSQTVTVTVEKLVTKEIPVRVEQTGDVEGKIIKSSSEKETVPISGAKSELDMIEAVLVSVDVTGITETKTEKKEYTLVLKDDADREDLDTIGITETLVSVTNTVYEPRELPIKVVTKTGNETALNEVDTATEPKTVKVGISEGVNVEYITVTIDEGSGEGEYKLDKLDGVYIPDKNRTVIVKPIWNQIN